MNTVLLVVLVIVGVNALILAGLLAHYNREQRSDDEGDDLERSSDVKGADARGPSMVRGAAAA